MDAVGQSLMDRIAARARELGFDAMGVAAAQPDLDRDYDRYRAFIAAGMHGEMAYLGDHGDVRRGVRDPRIVDGAESVICLARMYHRRDGARDPPLARLVARYARAGITTIFSARSSGASQTSSRPSRQGSPASRPLSPALFATQRPFSKGLGLPDRAWVSSAKTACSSCRGKAPWCSSARSSPP